MSRFYNLIVTPMSIDGVAGTPVSWTNQANGKAILSAQRIEFDLSVSSGDNASGGAWIRVWGPTRQQIAQASDFNRATIKLYGGMQKGLPLATRAVETGQQGLLAQGTVIQCFSNYQGLVQTLEFNLVVTPLDVGVTSDAARQAENVGASPPPQNFSFTWKQGSSLVDNVQAVLKTVFAGCTVNVSAADDIILLHDEPGAYPDFRTFATFVLKLSQNIKGSTYRGLTVAPSGAKSFNIFDNTKVSGKIVDISMFDLIGQVTWLTAATVTFTTVLRADLTLSTIITFPPLAAAQAITTADSQSIARTGNTFNGNWIITDFARHVGDSRAPDAAAWVSVFQAVAMDVSPS